ncbi:DUF3857 domain-containing transglutaminase family protein [bacterium]|nr:DUF3857 domain-containing transglutaminase family protein [candidate division CSSED10-310 bacterium]
MRHLVIVLCGLCLLITPLHADFTVEEIMDAAPPAGEYPDATALHLAESHRYELTTDGVITYTHERITKLIKPGARETFADFPITYDRRDEVVEIDRARTISSHGLSQEVEAGAVNEVTPLFLSGAAIYAEHISNKVLSFPAVSDGSTLDIKYTTRTLGDAGKPMGGVIYLQGEEPLLRVDVELLVPQTTGLHYAFVGMDGELASRIENGITSYSVSLPGGEMIKWERNMPPQRELAARLVFGTAGSWSDAIAQLRIPFEKACTPARKVTKQARRLTKQFKEPWDQVEALFTFVARDLRGIPMPLGLGGFEPHDAAAVLTNRYGDQVDKCVLLTTMLRAVGLDAQAVLVASGRIPVIREVPAIEQFDTLLVRVLLPDGSEVFLNPMTEHAKFPYFFHGQLCEGLTLTSEPVFCVAAHHATTQSTANDKIELYINRDGSASGIVDTMLDGYFDFMAREELADKTPRELDMFMEQVVSDLSTEAEERSRKISDPRDGRTGMRLTLEADVPDVGINQGSVMLVELPDFPLRFARLPVAPTLAERTLPFRFPEEVQLTETYMFHLPAGYQVMYLPDGFSIELPCGLFQLEANRMDDADCLQIKRQYTIRERSIAPTDYAEFKAAMDRFDTLKYKLIMVEQGANDTAAGDDSTRQP